MVVKFFFKRVVPSFLLYYGGLQVYLVLHLYSTPGGVRDPIKLPAIKVQESRKTLVENVLSVYHCKATSGSFATFTNDVQFEDPTVIIKGRDDLKNVAFMMRALLKSETLSLKEHHYEDQFILELHQKYTLFGLEFKMPSVIYVELEGKKEEQKVKKLNEEWFGKVLITPENTPFLYTGVTSRFFRNVHGKLCNLVRFDEPK